VSTITSPVSGVNIALLPDGTTPNTTAMTGGSDPESTESIRANAGQAFRAQQRAVSVQDYNDLALNVPGVTMVNAVAQHSTSVVLYVAGPNYQGPGPALTDAVLNYFADKTVNGTTLSVVPPAVIPIDVGTSGQPVQLTVKDGFAQANVVTRVTTALQALFSPPNISFGQLLTISAAYEAILAVDGVAYCIIPVFTREDTTQANTNSIQLRPSEFASPGAIHLTVQGGFTS